MKFYRNLGPIAFEDETSTLQIFTAEPSTTIFQSKSSDNYENFVDEVAKYYNSSLHCQNFSVYSEPNKGWALLITNSKKAVLSHLDTYCLCQLILEASSRIQHLCRQLQGCIGSMSISQFRSVANKNVFVWIPSQKVKDQPQSQELILKKLLEMIKSMTNQKDISQKLLLKKLQKCKRIHELIQEVKYFSNVYCIGKNQTKENKSVLMFPNSGTKRSTSRTTKKKLNIFNIQLHKGKKLKPSSLHALSLTTSYIRQPFMSISLSVSKRNQSLAQSCPKRSSMKSQAQTKSSWGKASGMSLTKSVVKAQNPRRQKTIKRQSKQLRQAAYTPVNFDDEQKLLQKLRSSKKRLDQKKQKFSEIEKQKSSYELNKPNIPSQLINECKSLQEAQTVQPDEIKKVSLKKITQNQTAVASAPVELTKRMKASIVDAKLKQDQEKTINAKPVQKICSEKNKAFKKEKKVFVQDYEEEIEVIDFGKKPQTVKKALQMQQTKSAKEPKEKTSASVNELSKEPYEKSAPEVLKQEKGKQKSVWDPLISKCRQLNLMGVAVANTPGHLSRYESIFWELPLFFIYRGFYIKRLNIANDVEALEKMENRPTERPNEICQLLDQNVKIKTSLTKLLKTVQKKLRKQDCKLQQQLKAFLTLSPQVNCHSIMKNFIHEYIESLTAAVKSDVKLCPHLMEIIDAYLIFCGVCVKENKWEEVQRKGQLMEYINERKNILKQYP